MFIAAGAANGLGPCVGRRFAACRASVSDGLLKRRHEIDEALALRPRLRGGGSVVDLGVDQGVEGLGVVVSEVGDLVESVDAAGLDEREGRG